MKEILFSGSLAEMPFPQLLFKIWQNERSGCLRLQKGPEERSLYFDKGHIVVENETFSDKDFLAALVKKKVIEPDEAEECERFAGAHSASLIRALSELGLISPQLLWKLIESFFARQLFSLFDLPRGDFAFEPGDQVQDHHRFGLIQTHAFILQGVRRMQNSWIMEQFLPAEDQAIQVSAPYFLHLLNLEAHEKYALQILSSSASLKSFYDRCELGRKEGQKILFAFFNLGIASVVDKNQKAKTTAECFAFDPGKIQASFDEKCATIYKYVSKELGLVAQNVLNKCLEEIRPSLGPLFQKMQLLPDGRIEVDAAVKMSVNHLAEDLFKNLVKGYEEILMAEVLAVKKSLGNVHESALVKNLEKVGCL
jgi:hypothetical protein